MSIVNDLKTTWKKGKDVALNAPVVERKVKDATSNEKWGPTGTQMQEISRASYNMHDFAIIMSVIWKRINDPGKYWRHVYKSLLLINYLILNGSELVIRECRNHLIEIQTLTEFQHIEEDKDVGLSVRERAKQVIELLHDDKRIKGEREKAKANRDKYKGVGNSAVGYGNDSYGGGGSSYDSYDSYGGGGGGRDSYGGGSDSYGGGRDSYGGGRDSYGGGSDSYGGGRDTYGRDSSRDFGKYGSDENYNDDRNDYAAPRSSIERTTSERTSTTSDSGRRPRAASGGSGDLPAPTSSRIAPPTPQGDLLGGINDLVSAPAPTPAAPTDLFANLNLGGPSPTQGFGDFNSAPATTSFNSNPTFNAFPQTSFQQAPAPTQDFFNPRGGDQAANNNADWGDFQSSNGTGEFNPFSGQGGDFGNQGHEASPKKEDPWEKNKKLFNLDNINVAGDVKPATTSTSGTKVPMGSKAPMSKAPMSTSSTTLTARPNASGTLTPTQAPNYSAGAGLYTSGPGGLGGPGLGGPGMGGPGYGVGGPGMGGPGYGVGGPGLGGPGLGGPGLGGPGLGGPGYGVGGPGMGGPGYGVGGPGMGGPGYGMGGPGIGMGGPGLGMGGPGMGMGGPGMMGGAPYGQPGFASGPNYAAGAGLGTPGAGPRRY